MNLCLSSQIEEDAKRRRVREMRSYSQGVIGGGWELLNEEGKLERSKILAGNYVLMYFGEFLIN